MDELTLARAVHVLAVVHWIGGVAMVTLVLLPAIRKSTPAAERLSLFELLENRFAFQARISTLIAGLSGFYMTYVLDAWDRFFDPTWWWMHAMVAIWLIFVGVLFVAEPLFLDRWFHEAAQRDPDRTYALVQRFHIVVLSFSSLTVLASVLGAHGAL